jgi:hypothetical protein
MKTREELVRDIQTLESYVEGLYADLTSDQYFTLSSNASGASIPQSVHYSKELALVVFADEVLYDPSSSITLMRIRDGKITPCLIGYTTSEGVKTVIPEDSY